MRICVLGTFSYLFVTVLLLNGCKPAIDPNANRVDYIRILDIGSVASPQLLYTAVQTPPIRMKRTSDDNLAILSTVSLPFHDTSHYCIQLTKVSLNGKIIWNHVYQDSGANLIANDFTLSTDGGFLIASTRSPSNAQYAAVLGTNIDGDSLWFKEYKTSFGVLNNCVSSLIIPTQDNKYIVCGTYVDPRGGYAFGPYLQLIHPNGDNLGTVLGTVIPNHQPFSSNTFLSNKDGSFFVVASSPTLNSNTPYFYTIQFDSITQQATAIWTTSPLKTIHSIAESQNGFIFFGDSLQAKGAPKQYAVIYGVPDDGNFVPIWQDSYDPGDNNSFTSGIHTLDGGYLASGYSVTRSDTSIFIAKIDGTGKKQWSKTYPGTGDQATSVLQAPDGTYIVAGVTTSFGGRGGSNQAFIMRLNTNGDYVN